MLFDISNVERQIRGDFKSLLIRGSGLQIPNSTVGLNFDIMPRKEVNLPEQGYQRFENRCSVCGQVAKEVSGRFDHTGCEIKNF